MYVHMYVCMQYAYVGTYVYSPSVVILTCLLCLTSSILQTNLLQTNPMSAAPLSEHCRYVCLK